MAKPTLIKLVSVLLLTTALVGCKFWQTTAKPVVSFIDDIARQMCAVHYSQAQGISVEDAIDTVCKAREQFAPWIDPALAATQNGASLAAGEPPAVSMGCSPCECQ